MLRPPYSLSPLETEALADQARAICARCAQTRFADALCPLGNYGGFSGARLWRVQSGSTSFCLRAWPPEHPAASNLPAIHDLMRMAHKEGLHFVPATVGIFESAGRLWDITSWLSGVADFARHPTELRLRAAFQALARIHTVWKKVNPANAACPALIKRHNRLSADWSRDLAVIQAELRRHPPGPLADLAHRLLTQFNRWRLPVLQSLRASLDRPFPLQPCLRDIWHDHVLFEGEEISGIVDYEAVGHDSVATDLARLAGSLVGNDSVRWQIALNAYEQIRPLADRERELAPVLDRAGVVAGAAGWLRWLFLEKRRFDHPTRVIQRLAELLHRMETPDFAGV